ncbi:MAG: NAD-dependent epimerase/dehydratase family protein [Thermoanaerobaculia bacterium]
MDRRRFLRTSLGASAAALLPRLMTSGPLAGAIPRKILVLGGTSFLGPAVVEAAVVAGHSVTLFNRGITNPALFPTLEKLRGFRSPDRTEENFTALGQRRWDVVVDVWPSDPSVVESAARVLRDRTTQYLYVSSIAAYDPKGFAQPHLTESAPLNAWDTAVRPYNRGKAESERRLLALLGDRLTVVRPGPIKGDRDTTPDLLAWLRRAQTATTHIGPGSGEDHVQLVDVKDVARFLVLAIDRSLHGTFNLTGAPMSFREFLARCVAATRSSADFVWIPREFLHQHGLDPDPSYLGKFPFWHPEPERRGLFQISSQKAFDAGWTQRPFTETALEYLWFFDQLDPGVWQWTDELSEPIEASALAAWRESKR